MVCAVDAQVFPHELAERLAGKIIEDTDAHTVMAMLGLERMDLISEGIGNALKDWHKFDPSKSQPQTFLHPRINAGIFNYLRKEGSQSRRIRAFGGQEAKPDKNRELIDWLEEVYEASKRVYVSGRLRQGRRTHDAPRLVAIARLMEHLHLSCRECARLLAKREDIRSVLKLQHIPYYSTINRAASLLKVATATAISTPEVATAN